MLEHGGRLREAARHWGIALEEWLDLSTGIAPWPYQPQIPAAAWQRLPEDDDGLEAAAALAYGHPAPLPVPGSQAAIQWLPRLLPAGRVALPAPSYGEYALAWQAAGHRVAELPWAALTAAADECDVLMLGNPNNPTTERLDAESLRKLARRLQARGGWLVVDEAFGPPQAGASLAALAGGELPRLVVLRSLGKFFGLAGARVGFVCAAPALRQQLAEALGPWALSHPSREAARQALADQAWQARQAERLAQACARLGELLAAHGLASHAAGDLFRYAPSTEAEAWYAHLARRGILVRRFRTPPALRFGLPGSAAQWARLEQALKEFHP